MDAIGRIDGPRPDLVFVHNAALGRALYHIAVAQSITGGRRAKASLFPQRMVLYTPHRGDCIHSRQRGV